MTYGRRWAIVDTSQYEAHQEGVCRGHPPSSGPGGSSAAVRCDTAAAEATAPAVQYLVIGI